LDVLRVVYRVIYRRAARFSNPPAIAISLKNSVRFKIINRHGNLPEMTGDINITQNAKCKPASRKWLAMTAVMQK